MSTILRAADILATPPPSALPTGPQFPGLESMTWTDQGGTSWDMMGSTGVLLMATGTRGLGMPPVDRFSTGLAGLAGSRNTGYRVKERDVFWPLFLRSSLGSQAWLDLDTAFWAGMRPDWVGTWSVTHPNGSVRSLHCRYGTDNDPSFGTDPSLLGWALYGVNLVAEDPFWVGRTIGREFSPGGNSAAFLSSAGLWINRGDTTASASVTNLGDVDAWPIYTIFGPTTSVDIGVSGQLIQVHFVIPDGKAVIIDTDPLQRTALEATASRDATSNVLIATPTGVDLSSQLGQTPWAPIPTGTNVPLVISAVGTGVVRVEITTRYFRAW